MLLVLALAAGAAQAQTPPREALDGIDPVLLVQGKEVQGKSEFKVSRGRFDYLFATAENKAAFEKDPGRYEIQLGGMCARMGGGATGNPADYFVYNGRIYIFGSDDCHKKFVAAPEKYLPKPVAPMSTDAADARRGRELVDRAVKALGGADRLDAVTTYVETSSQVQKRPTGEAAVTTKTMYRLPADVRVERTVTAEGRTYTSGGLLTATGSWYVGRDRMYPQLPEARPAAEQEVLRQIVPLLHARNGEGFKAVAVAGSTLDGVTEDRVRIRNGSVDVTLGLEKSSGRIHSVSYIGRGREAELGDVVLVYGDFRDVNGLHLPFSERGLFNGEPYENLTRTLDAIAINTPLEAALFEATTTVK
jgi:YHS domain-containing protein